MTEKWLRTLVLPSGTLQQTLAAIDASTLQIAMVVDAERRLLGTVTDGDIRRGILRGLALDAATTDVMNAAPVTARVGDSPSQIAALMRARHILHIPLVDAAGRVVGLCQYDEVQAQQRQDNWVVLMAGGLGSRLGALTADCPKPLLRVGGKPVLQTILEHFIEQGYHRFFLAVNYRADMLVSHFGDGSRWGCDIRYLHEVQRMGTAGALTLLPERPELPLVVMNGDLLTKLDFTKLLRFHTEQGVDATMVTREYAFQVPYGVVKSEGGRLLALEEKPIHTSEVSAGIYVIGPEVLDRLGKVQAVEMPTVFEDLVAAGRPVATYLSQDYWIDIGHLEDLDRAQRDFDQVFRSEGK